MITKEIVQAFCGNESDRYQFPMLGRDGELVATNDRVLIVLAPGHGIEPWGQNKRSFPDITRITGFMTGKTVSVEVVDFTEIPKKKCSACDGEGVVLADSLLPEICDRCNGSGLGNKEDDWLYLSGALFQTSFIKLLRQLPGCLITITNKKNEPQHIEFDGGFGFIMPAKEDADE